MKNGEPDPRMTLELTRKDGGGLVLEPRMYMYTKVSPCSSHSSGFYTALEHEPTGQSGLILHLTAISSQAAVTFHHLRIFESCV